MPQSARCPATRWRSTIALPDHGCTPADGPLCGRLSVPANLPADARGFSHTSLILQALRTLGWAVH